MNAKNLLVCCGGGGLTSGIATAMASCAPHIVVRPVEPKGFDDVARSLRAGKIKSNDKAAGSICDAIVTPQPGDLTFPIMKQHCGSGLVVSDEECLKTIAIAYSRLKIVLEPGGAVALAAAIFKKELIEGDDVIAVASGGNVDPTLFRMALEKYS